MNRYFSKVVLLLSLVLPFLTLALPMSLYNIGFPIPFIIYDGPAAGAIHHAYELFNWSNLRVSFIKIDYYLLNAGIWYGVLILIKASVQRLRAPQA
ncbi:hypothetical protein [Paenibacillus aquistagni]|uniref:hypothetical protein n=1 Tax=Paenibacillus aquistagni TaxID=1852522 RepID=UPI00145BD63B|nr:hypothetical protein [Paenibacillus aquistagni]NMM54015.1 hypothetical protein [Paenibacillus aquistagni]